MLKEILTKYINGSKGKKSPIFLRIYLIKEEYKYHPIKDKSLQTFQKGNLKLKGEKNINFFACHPLYNENPRIIEQRKDKK